MRLKFAVCALILALVCEPAAAQLFDRTDAQREIELGRQTAGEVERVLPVSRDAAMIARVKRIGEALVAAMPQRAYPYRFSVLDVQDFNAFCLPGGFMYVFEGLLDRLPDDDAVAFVMAHEITHASHRHWKRMVEKMRGPAVLAALAGAVLGAEDVAGITSAMVQSQYSREQEYDADSGGIELATAAGYDPAGAVAAAQAMAKLDGDDRTPTYLRSHPPARDRLAQLEARAAKLRQENAPGTKVITAIPGPDVLPPAGQKSAELDFLPLSVGNVWEYATKHGSNEVRYRVSIEGKASTEAGTVWRVSTLLPPLDATTAFWFPSGSGIWTRPLRAKGNPPWSLAMPAPHSDQNAHNGQDVETLPPRTIVTPCGRFENCIGVRTTSGSRQVETWYSRGVGMVQRITQPLGTVETLTNYRLQNATRQATRKD